MFRGFSLLFILSSLVQASTFDARGTLSQSAGAKVSLGWEERFLEKDPLHFRVAPRLTLFPTFLHRFDYAGEVGYSLFTFLHLNTRLHHGILLSDTASVSQLMPSIKLDLTYFFIEVGWYFRILRLHKVAPFPYASDASENDIATQFGFRAPIGDDTLSLIAGTIDSVDIYNLNNPYAEILYSRGTHWSAYIRYKLLLGFGRMDEVTICLAIAI